MNPLRILLISHTYFPSAYRGKLRQLAARADVELCLAAIPAMKTATGWLHYEQSDADTFPQRLLPSVLPSHNILRLYSPRPLVRLLRGFHPHIVQIEVEPHALALTQIILLRAMMNYRILFFTWENIYRPLPWPIGAVERFNLSHTDGAIAGNGEAVTVLRRRGFHGSVTVIPQVGIDPTYCKSAYANAQYATLRQEGNVVGFVGRIVTEKGVMDLLEAFAQLPTTTQLLLVGAGALNEDLQQCAIRRGVRERVHLVGNVAFRAVPSYLKCMDMLVVPSRTIPKWKEQFGHVLVEAMACGVPVIGSDSGAIPEVIGDAGLVFPEGDITVLHQQLVALLNDAALRSELSQRGRQRVAEHYSDAIIAEQSYRMYRRLCP